MRNGQNKRMRGRNNNNHRKSQNPMTRVYESNGPDVKIRGTPSHIAEKYIQLARDAHTSGDPVSAENYYQHAEHYLRLIAAAQEQFRQNNPHFSRPENESQQDDGDDGDDEDMGQPPQSMGGGGDGAYGTREPQPYLAREPQPYLPRDAQPFPQHQTQPVHQPVHQHQPSHQPTPHQSHQPQQHAMARPQPPAGGDVDRLPSFITGGGAPPPQQPQQGHAQNGHDNQPDRFPLHRRRRRHRGPRHDLPGGPASDGSEESSPRGE
jgi:Domain of unknown function (DUF4167)